MVMTGSHLGTVSRKRSVQTLDDKILKIPRRHEDFNSSHTTNFFVEMWLITTSHKKIVF